PLEERAVELAAEARLEAYAALGHAAPFASRLLALLGGEGLEGVVEARVAAVAPVGLAVAPQQPALRRAGGARRLIEKQRVHARDAVGHGVALERVEERAADAGAVELRSHEQARPGRGSERRGERQLRIVAAPEALVGLRPAEVEHEFPVGMALEI